VIPPFFAIAMAWLLWNLSVIQYAYRYWPGAASGRDFRRYRTVFDSPQILGVVTVFDALTLAIFVNLPS
jgi:hypothetical protein